MTTGGILFPSLAVLYLYTCSGRTTHSVPDYIVPEPHSITEPYECRSDGSLHFCIKDNCKMRWKPPGTHHCSTCGVCRIGFDHHCPWVRQFEPLPLSSIDALANPAEKLRHHRPPEGLLGLARLDVDHGTSCKPTTLTSPEDPRHRCAGSIPRGRLDHGYLVESPLLFDTMRRPSRTLDRRHPTRFPRATGASHPGAIVAEWSSRRPAARALNDPRRRCNSDLAIRRRAY